MQFHIVEAFIALSKQYLQSQVPAQDASAA